ncbi:MAG: MBL fold metallo-hydrolase [Candidatus Lokiarchaeota archaeon]|nr:MBL fold metallo-hydrolase [Candidatus Lokiarchaeota archaeon]
MSEISITWNATANMRVEWKNNIIFFDPWFTRNQNADPRLGNTIDFVDDGASIFMSHGHFDHLQDVPAILLAKQHVHVYCSATARSTIEQQLRQKLIVGADATRAGSCLDRVHSITAGDAITREGSNITVEAIKSDHVKFDARSVLRVLFSLQAWKGLGDLLKVVKEYPKGEVLGYDVHFGNEGRLVFFGSLCNKHPEILKQHAKPDVLVLPIAGRFNCDEIALEVTRVVAPKVVIPVHHDDFYPPISYWTPLDALKDGAGKLDPPVRYVELLVEQAAVIPLS